VNDELVYQPYVDFSHESGIYGWFWGNMDLTDNRNFPQNEFSEIDLVLGYGTSFDRLNLSVEYAEYFFPSVSGTNTREIFLRANYDTVLQPTLTLIRDVGEADGLYIMVSFSENLFSQDEVSLDLTASFGWADSGYLDYYFGYNDSSSVDANVGFSASRTFSNGISVAASVNYTWIIGDEGLASMARSWYEYDNIVWGGVSISHSF